MKTFFTNLLSSHTSPATSINCTDEANYDLYAECILRDDITPQLHITFIILFVINCALLAKNICNLISIHRLKRTKNLKYMLIFNALLLPTILIQMALYANSFWLELGFSGYSLMVYSILDMAQVLVLNNLFALGAYFWMKMLFRLTFNNARVKSVKKIFILCCVINLAFLIITSLCFVHNSINDETKWADVKETVELMYLLCASSTIINGLFFSLGVFFGYRFTRNASSGQSFVSNLAILAALISVLRVAQDLIQALWPLLVDLKRNSALNGDWNYSIYLIIFLLIANIIPEVIFLKRYAPSRNQKLAKFSNMSSYAQSTNIVDDPMSPKANDKHTVLLFSP